MEEWRPIEGFGDRYEVSDKGRVRSSYKRAGFNGILNQQQHRNGYMKVDLKYRASKKTIDVHRLVAQAFIPNPKNKTDVNHIDGNKANNVVSNLEWCTRKENMAHCHTILQRGGRAKRPVKCLETGVIYTSLHEAAAATGACLGPLHCALNGRYRTAGGFHWEYAD